MSGDGLPRSVEIAHAHTQSHMHTHTQSHMHTHTHTCTHTVTHAHTHAHMHAHTNRHIHTHPIGELGNYFSTGRASDDSLGEGEWREGDL